MVSEGLVQGNNFKLWIMAEVPSVILRLKSLPKRWMASVSAAMI